jgi:hypothetical protein
MVNAINYTTPYGLAASASKTVIGFIRSVDDPTEKSIPMMGTNPEAKFFSTLEDFRFEDGGRFDSTANRNVRAMANPVNWRIPTSARERDSYRQTSWGRSSALWASSSWTGYS